MLAGELAPRPDLSACKVLRTLTSTDQRWRSAWCSCAMFDNDHWYEGLTRISHRLSNPIHGTTRTSLAAHGAAELA